MPTDLAIQLVCQHFSKWHFLSRMHSLTTADIPQLLEFCLNATYFAFWYSLYQQVHGSAVGSLVSVVVADLVTSMWLGLQIVPSLERCPLFTDRFVHSSMWLGLQTVSSLERCQEAFMEMFHSIYIRTWSHTKTYFWKQAPQKVTAQSLDPVSTLRNNCKVTVD